MRKIACACVALCLSFNVAFADGSSNEYTHKNLNEQLVMSLAWMKASAEYEALCHQAYNALRSTIDNAVASRKGNSRPLAIVVDGDETILDNIEYEAALVGTDRTYESKSWSEWCRAAKSKAIVGAVDCLQYAKKNNVEVFYVANRVDDEQYGWIAKNLKQEGFPYVDRKHLLLRKNRNGDKQPRFDQIMKSHDIIAFVGDNLADFPVQAYKQSNSIRKERVAQFKDEFGKKFILLPNPAYGGWEEGLAKGYMKMSPKEQNRARKEVLFN